MSVARPSAADAGRDEARDDAELAVVDAWCKADHLVAVLPVDHDVIESTRSLRGLIAATLARRPQHDDRDLLNAFGALGQLTAQGRGSPTLAASSVDGLLDPTNRDVALAAAARAAMVESYVFARIAELRVEALRAWEYPATVVPISAGSVAIAAGYPAGEDGLDDWASRVAQRAAMSGARRAVVSGSERAVEAVQAALEVAGVEVTLVRPAGPLKPPPSPPR